MKKICIYFIFLTAFLFFGVISTLAFPTDFPLSRKISPSPPADPPPASAPQDNDGEWVTMPEGGKPAYMGIHGGTMPVSLLVSRDGSSLFTFVGRTGNDFLEALRRAYTAFPSIGNSTRPTSAQQAAISQPQTGLFAGNATASMPVIALSGDRLANQAWFRQLRPFGLSPKPLSIEGEVAKPEAAMPAKPYRIFFLPDYFQPRRGVK